MRWLSRVSALTQALKLLREAGKRNSASDQQIIQTIHDHAAALGACCAEPDEMMERDIPQSERDQMADSDFAGKGTSFPIKVQADVEAAMHSLGRAGSDNFAPEKIRANIIRIAKRKGLKIPDSAKAEADTWKPEGVLLVEGARFCEEPRLQEAAGATYPVRLISPGRGSSGYYSAEVLKRAAEAGRFPPNTQMFWNHDTDAEESARPEGDLTRLAAVTTTYGRWEENGIEGPGVYSMSKVFADYADKVKEMGPHIGVSIRAGGDRDESAKGPDGKPRVITEIRNVMSNDFVTKPGRGGKIFTESASAEIHKENDMEETAVRALLKETMAPLETKLTEAQAENKRLRERLAQSDAPKRIREALKDIRLPDFGKQEVIKRMMKDGIPDDPKELNEAVDRTALDVTAFLQEAGYGANVSAFGARLDTNAMREASKEAIEAHEKNLEKSLDAMASIFVGPKLVTGSDEVREARTTARTAFREGRNAA